MQVIQTADADGVSGGCSGTTGSGWCRVLPELRQAPHGWCDVLHLLRKSLCGCGTYACTGSGSRTGSCSRRSTGGTARRTGSGYGSGNSGSCSGGCTGRSAGTALPQLRQSGSGGESFLYPLRSRNDRPAGSRRACTGNAPAGCTGTHLPQLRKACPRRQPLLHFLRHENRRIRAGQTRQT